MKRPLLSLSVFCVVFFGIIIFCVIFGGYSSLYRAQNRIGAAKQLVTDECQKQLDLLPELVDMVRKTDSFNGIDSNLNQANLDQIRQTALEAKTILTQIDSRETTPLEKKLILNFEESQVKLSREIIGLITGLKKDDSLKSSPAFIGLEKEFNDLEITVFYNSHKYNKEARYFNTRKSLFPGFFVAKLFGLDKVHFFEITASLFTPEKLRS